MFDRDAAGALVTKELSPGWSERRGSATALLGFVWGSGSSTMLTWRSGGLQAKPPLADWHLRMGHVELY
jgi:hypothetical protein